MLSSSVVCDDGRVSKGSHVDAPCICVLIRRRPVIPPPFFHPLTPCTLYHIEMAAKDGFYLAKGVRAHTPLLLPSLKRTNSLLFPHFLILRPSPPSSLSRFRKNIQLLDGSSLLFSLVVSNSTFLTINRNQTTETFETICSILLKTTRLI